MKILHVIRTMNPAWGGPVEGLKNIATQAAIAGHELQIACLDDANSPWLTNVGVQVNAIGCGHLGKFGFSRRLDSWLARNIRRFDVIVANGIWMYFSSAVRRAAIRAGIPYFVFTHGALDPWFRRQYPLKHVKKQIYWALFERKVVRDASAVLFTTAEEQALSDGAFWPYHCNARTVGYGIADPYLSQCSLLHSAKARGELSRVCPELGNRKFLLFLARIHEKKGIDLLLQAIARNLRDYQEHAFVIAGPGEAAYVSQLKTLASQLGLEKHVIWSGPLYGAAKWAVLTEAEAYILPSHQENFGISVVESLSCRVPVLITDKVNIWREIAAERAGLVGSDDVSGVCTLLERWSRISPEQRRSMRAAARECFLSKFDVASTSSTLFNLLAAGSRIDHHNEVLQCAS